MSFPPRFLDEIKTRLTLSEIIGRRISVTRAGREYKACCPFHKEKTPSFTINDQKGFYHCFGCGAHGDVIRFVSEYDNLSFPEAVEVLAGQAGLEVPKQSPQEVQKAKQEKSLYSLIDDTTKFFTEQLFDHANREMLDYVLSRGILEDTIHKFRLGFSPADGDALRKYLLARDYTEPQMIEAGVLKKSTRGGNAYSFFRERIMFPVSDRRGRIVAFGGRILPDHMRAPDRGDFKPPKYINSGDNPVFHKSNILYGEALARQFSYDQKDLSNPRSRILVTEGYMDVIACAQAGFKGAVAPMGTSITDEQIVSLWKLIPADAQMKEPVLCFDGDNAGRRAAERACDKILPMLEPGKSACFAFMPQGEDPDSLIKSSGADGFAKVIKGAMPLVDFLWSRHTAGRNFETPEARAALQKTLNEETAKIASRDVQSHYRSILNSRISEMFFARKSYGGKNYSKGKGGTSLLKPRAPSVSGGDLKSRILLACLINHPHIFGDIEEQCSAFGFAHGRYDALRQNVIQLLNEEDYAREDLLNSLNDLHFEKEIGDILSQSVYIHAAFAAPSYNEPDIAGKWLQIWSSSQGQALRSEITQGLKDVVQNDNTERETQIIEMMRENMKDQTGEV